MIDMAIVPGWADCLISRDGSMTRHGLPKKATLGRVGYLVYQRSEGNKTSQRYVHRILLEAFVGPCPEGCEALHINGNPLDNRLENLRWGTRKENVADAIRHGTAAIGHRNAQSKLSPVDLLSIKRLREKRVPTREIAERFDVTPETISNALAGRTYKGETA